jgi:hypothetical protein
MEARSRIWALDEKILLTFFFLDLDRGMMRHLEDALQEKTTFSRARRIF